MDAHRPNDRPISARRSSRGGGRSRHSGAPADALAVAGDGARMQAGPVGDRLVRRRRIRPMRGSNNLTNASDCAAAPAAAAESPGFSSQDDNKPGPRPSQFTRRRGTPLTQCEAPGAEHLSERHRVGAGVWVVLGGDEGYGEQGVLEAVVAASGFANHSAAP